MKQKKDILVRLYRVWLNNNELRMGQLLSIVFEKNSVDEKGNVEHELCLFGVEDFDFIEKIETNFTKREAN